MEVYTSDIINNEYLANEESASTFIKRYFGKGAYLSGYLSSKVSVGANVPKIVEFEEGQLGQKKLMKFMKFDNVFELSFKRTGEQKIEISYPPLNELERRIEERISLTYSNVEKLLLSATRSKLIKLSSVRNSLMPFETILLKLLNNGRFSRRDIKNLSVYKSKKKTEEYLRFLTELGYIRLTNSGYEEGNPLVAMQQKKAKRSEILDNVLSAIVSMNYDYIYRFMKVYSIMPYIRIANAYYYQTWLVDRLLNFKLQDIVRFHNSMYPHMKLSTSRNLIVERDILQMSSPEVEILKYNSNTITGEESIFEAIRNK